MAEGAGRSSTKEFIRYLDIATGSLSELETQLLLVQRLGFSNYNESLEEQLNSIGKMLYGLKLSLKKKIK